MDDVGEMFKKAAKNLEKAFSADALDALMSGKFLDSVLFYVLCVQTFFYIYSLVWGWGQDIKDAHTFLEREVKMAEMKKEVEQFMLLGKDDQVAINNN